MYIHVQSLGLWCNYSNALWTPSGSVWDSNNEFLYVFRLTGFHLPPPVTSTKSVFSLRLTSDFAVSAHGFKVYYEGKWWSYKRTTAQSNVVLGKFSRVETEESPGGKIWFILWPHILSGSFCYSPLIYCIIKCWNWWVLMLQSSLPRHTTVFPWNIRKWDCEITIGLEINKRE